MSDSQLQARVMTYAFPIRDRQMRIVHRPLDVVLQIIHEPLSYMCLGHELDPDRFDRWREVHRFRGLSIAEQVGVPKDGEHVSVEIAAGEPGEEGKGMLGGR